MRRRPEFVAALLAACALVAMTGSAVHAGMPAARAGDLTSGGGSIGTGAPTVLICGKAAARSGDRVAVRPGAGGPSSVTIASGSATVLIAGRPAARVGDALSSGGSITAPGCPTVLIGS